MGLVSKLKNILFEEEEVEIPVLEKKEKKPEVVREYKEAPENKEVKITNYQDYGKIDNALENSPKMEEYSAKQNTNTVSEREIFKSEKTFNFPAFDEEEFDSYVPKKRPTNVLERERKVEKKQEYRDYRKDYGYRKFEKTEEVKETKKFRPSPIISPVYGILDKNYTPDEITTREDTSVRTLDVDTVRKKAFGAAPKVEEPIKVEVQDEEILTDQKVLEERLEKARTIDELLKDSSDEVIDVPVAHDEESFESFKDIDKLEDNPLRDDASKKESVDDTLENDLFDLIDSMYENREEDK